MYWHNAEDCRDLWSEDWLYDECENSIKQGDRASGDPRIIVVLTPKLIEIPQGGWKHPIALVLTDTLVVAARKKGIVGRRADIKQWNRYDFPQCGVGPWRGSGPLHEVRLDHDDEGRLRFVFKSPASAVQVGEYFASG